MTIRRNTKNKGPQVSVPAVRTTAEPLPGNASFARRVKKTRRRGSQSTNTDSSMTPQSPAKRAQPAILTREQRLAAARTAPSSRNSLQVGVTTPASAKAASTAPNTGRQAARKVETQPKPQRDPDPGFVAVGRIQAPYGLHGEVKVTSLTENPERFRPKAKLFAGQQPVTVQGVREAGGFVFLSLKGFNDRTSVEKFRNTLLQVPEKDLPELEEGEYYRFQLVGLNVLDSDGIALGEIAEVIETGATDVFRITTSKKPDLLLAAAPDVILEIDIRAKRMVVDPPDWR